MFFKCLNLVELQVLRVNGINQMQEGKPRFCTSYEFSGGVNAPCSLITL